MKSNQLAMEKTAPQSSSDPRDEKLVEATPSKLQYREPKLEYREFAESIENTAKQMASEKRLTDTESNIAWRLAQVFAHDLQIVSNRWESDTSVPKTDKEKLAFLLQAFKDGNLDHHDVMTLAETYKLEDGQVDAMWLEMIQFELWGDVGRPASIV